MIYRKNVTFEVTKFEVGMEDGETYSSQYKAHLPYIVNSSGSFSFVTGECYITKNLENRSIDLISKYEFNSTYERVEENKK
jgi:hypothetical protein